MEKFNFGQPIYAHGEWWTLVQPLVKASGCFLVICRGDTLPTELVIVKQFEADRVYQEGHINEVQ